MTDTNINVITSELNRLLRNYRLREPQEGIVRHALREEFAERYPKLAHNYELRWESNGQPSWRMRVVLHLTRSAVDLLADLA